MKHARPPTSTPAAGPAPLLVLMFFLSLSAAASAQPKSGQLTLSSQPGAQVYWEGTPIGEVGADGTLLISAIPSGAYSLLLTKEGHRDLVVRLAIEPGDNRLQADLERIGEPPAPTREAAGAPEPAPVTVPDVTASSPSPDPLAEELDEEPEEKASETEPETTPAEPTPAAPTAPTATPVAEPDQQPVPQAPPRFEAEPLPETVIEAENTPPAPAPLPAQEPKPSAAASSVPPSRLPPSSLSPSSPGRFAWLAFLPLAVVAASGAYILQRRLNRRAPSVERIPASGPQRPAKASSGRHPPPGFIEELKQREQLLELQGGSSRPVKVVTPAPWPQDGTVGDSGQTDEG